MSSLCKKTKFFNKKIFFFFRNTNKRAGTIQLRRQLVNFFFSKSKILIYSFLFSKTDDGTSKQRTPPNSTGTSLSPISSSYLSRLSSSNDNSPIRTTNTIRLTSPSTNNNVPATKQVDAVALLLKQTIAPPQLIQVKRWR